MKKREKKISMKMEPEKKISMKKKPEKISTKNKIEKKIFKLKKRTLKEEETEIMK